MLVIRGAYIRDFTVFVVNVERTFFPRNLFLSFSIFGGLFNFLSCKVGAYSWMGAYFIATILQVIRCRGPSGGIGSKFP